MTSTGHRPALLAVHDVVDDGTAYRAELSVRVDQPVLSDDPILRHELQHERQHELQRGLQLPAPGGPTSRGRWRRCRPSAPTVAVRQQYMERAISEFVGIPTPAVSCWTTAHADVHWANLTKPLRLLD
ncbi:hypothetical protein [Streptomyces mirabilis]|uniref:hypothetical protein n=1 Tax=Streptomyces mirabilis TaxID=68239 RepID=UPI00369F3E7C